MFETKNKELFNLKSVLATSETVGNWGGQEGLAAEQFNKIIEAIYEVAPDNTYDSKLYEIIKYAWDDWGSKDELLAITEEEIKKYAESWF
jgi:hypothetical protein